MTKVADECVSRCGLPHIVVNNAAGNFISPTERLSPNAFRTIVDIVLNGTAIVTLEWGKRFINAKQGHSDFVSGPAFIGVQAIKAVRGSLVPRPFVFFLFQNKESLNYHCTSPVPMQCLKNLEC